MSIYNKKILIITSVYPSLFDCSSGTFIKKFVYALLRKGVDVVVINPISIFKYKKGEKYYEKITINNSNLEIFKPKIITFGSKILFLNSIYLNSLSFLISTIYTIFIRRLKFDYVYGHFLIITGLIAILTGQLFRKPSFVRLGEPNIDEAYKFGFHFVKKIYTWVNGVIVNSPIVFKDIIGTNLIRRDKLIVFPNGIDSTLFKPFNKIEMRKKYSLPVDKFIIIHAGRFVPQRGTKEVIEATANIEDIIVLYVGSGRIMPTDKNAVVVGKVHYEMMPQLLSAADILLFPNHRAGCSNILLEAMACGLPIISSIGEFNDLVLNDSFSIRLNPKDVNKIRESLIYLKNNPNLCIEMSKRALEHSKFFLIDDIINKILMFFEEKMV